MQDNILVYTWYKKIIGVIFIRSVYYFFLSLVLVCSIFVSEINLHINHANNLFTVSFCETSIIHLICTNIHTVRAILYTFVEYISGRPIKYPRWFHFCTFIYSQCHRS